MIFATSLIGVTVLALGGIFASGALDSSDGPAPGAELRVPAAPVAFTGSIAPGACPEEPVVDQVGEHQVRRGGLCHPAIVSTDERLTGIVTWSSNTDRYDTGPITYGFSGVTITNDGGSWRQVPRLEVSILDDSNGNGGPWVFVGQDGYDGLLAVARASDSGGGASLHGFIVEGELPPVPDILVAG